MTFTFGTVYTVNNETSHILNGTIFADSAVEASQKLDRFLARDYPGHQVRVVQANFTSKDDETDVYASARSL